jgi:hypothetical protein
MVNNGSSFAVLLIVSVGVALVVLGLIRSRLRALLDDVLGLPSGTVFYGRVLAIGVILVALSAALNVHFDLKSDAAFMEYAWKIADGLASALGMLCLFLTGYLVLVTILVAALKRRHD